MAVQTHQPGFGVLEDPSIFSSNVGGYENTRKRGREAGGVDGGSQIFMMQPQPSIPQPQKAMRLDHHHPALVSTGLQLAFGEQKINHLLPSCSCSLCDGSVVGQYNKELDLLLRAQGEQLRRALAVRQQAQYKQLLVAAEKSAAQILKNKQTELGRLVHRSAELENQLVQLRSESLAWQSKAMASQATANSLHAQIQQVVADAAGAAASGSGESPAEDAGSSCVGPNRAGEEGRPRCRACRERAVSVVVLPCRHLCLCEGCDAAGVAKKCPVCGCVGGGSVRVFLC